MSRSRAALAAALVLISVTAITVTGAMAADYPAPKEGDWIAKNFKFHTGETMPELKLHYTTIGEPSGQPVLVLHGSGGSAANMRRRPSRASCSGRARRSTPRILHHPSRQCRPRQILQTVRRIEDGISEI